MNRRLPPLRLRSINLAIAAVGIACAVGSIAISATPPQSTPGVRNDLPQPYRTTRDWGELPPGVKWAAVTAIEPAPDGTIYVVHRCFANSCAGRSEPRFSNTTAAASSSRRSDRACSSSRTVPPSIATAISGSPMPAAATAKDSRRQAQCGRQGTNDARQSRGQRLWAALFDQPTDVVVTPDGDIFVTDSHRNGKNNRVVRFTKQGTFVKEWGSKERAPGR